MSATGILWSTSRKPTKHPEAWLAEMDGRLPFIRPGLNGNVVPEAAVQIDWPQRRLSTQRGRSPLSIRSTGHAPKRSLWGNPGQLREAHSLGLAHVTAGSRRNGTRFRSAPYRTASSSARGLRAQTHSAERRTYLLCCFVASSVVPGGFDRGRRAPIAIRRCPRHPNGPSWPRDNRTSPR